MRQNQDAQGRTVRLLRVGEQVRHILSDVLSRSEVHDAVLQSHSVSVTEVRVSPDLRHATAYIRPLGGEALDEVLGALRKHVRYFRGEVARQLSTKYAPDLKFLPDESFEEGSRIDALLRDPKIARDLGDDRT